MKGKTTTLPVSYRMAVGSRVLAAVLGGYVVAALASVSLTMWLPVARADAVVTGMMTSFVAYLCAVLWCFACHSAWRAWFGLIVASLMLAALAALASLAGLGYWAGQS